MTNAVMMMKCYRCKWVGPRSELQTQSVPEPYEFWGMRGVEWRDYDACPHCGSDDVSEVETEVQS